MKLKTIAILLALFGAFALAQPGIEVATQDSSAISEAASAGIYTRIIDWYNDNLNYGTITLLMAVESSFIPFKRPVTLPFLPR